MPRRKGAAPALAPWPQPTPRKIEPFDRSKPLPEPDRAFLLDLAHQDRASRFERLLDRVQALEGLEQPKRWEGEFEEPDNAETDLDNARYALRQMRGNDEPNTWDEARVWRELYSRSVEEAKKLFQVACDLNDRLSEEIEDLDDHNNLIAGLRDDAKRLWVEVCT